MKMEGGNNERDHGISAVALEAVAALLSSKSQEKYEKIYNIFDSWRTLKKVRNIDKEVMLAFFHEKISFNVL
mgnify:CR=1 FL=1